MQGEKLGLIGGTIGTAIGGTSWLIVLGIFMKSILLTTVPYKLNTIQLVRIFGAFLFR